MMVNVTRVPRGYGSSRRHSTIGKWALWSSNGRLN